MQAREAWARRIGASDDPPEAQSIYRIVVGGFIPTNEKLGGPAGRWVQMPEVQADAPIGFL